MHVLKEINCPKTTSLEEWLKEPEIFHKYETCLREIVIGFEELPYQRRILLFPNNAKMPN